MDTTHDPIAGISPGTGADHVLPLRQDIREGLGRHVGEGGVAARVGGAPRARRAGLDGGAGREGARAVPVALGRLDECALVGMEPGEETRGGRQRGRLERDPHPAEEAEHRLLGVGARGRFHRRRASGLDGEHRGEVGPVRG